MYEEVVAPKQPRGIETFRGPPSPAQYNYKVVRGRAVRKAEVYQDLRRFPWRGEQQVQRVGNLYSRNATQTDTDLRTLPYWDRLGNPPSGSWPVVQGIETGSGPHPWLQRTPPEFPTVIGQPRFRNLDNDNPIGTRSHDHRASGSGHIPTGRVTDRSQYEDGPASGPRNAVPRQGRGGRNGRRWNGLDEAATTIATGLATAVGGAVGGAPGAMLAGASTSALFDYVRGRVGGDGGVVA